MLLNTRIKNKSEISCIACSSDGNFIATGFAKGVVRIFQVKSRKQIRSSKMHNKRVLAICYSPDVRLLASSGSIAPTIILFDVRSHTQINILSLENSIFVYTINFSPSGRFLASGSLDCYIRIWDIHDQTIVKSHKGNAGPLYCIDYSPDGTLIAYAGKLKQIKLWNIETDLELGHSLEGHTSSVLGLSFSKNGKNIVSGGEDRTIRIWDVETGAQLKCFNGHSSYAWPVLYSLDQQFIISGSNDKSIRLWNINTGQQRLLKGHYNVVSSLCISKDGRSLISAGYDGFLRIQSVNYAD